MFIFIIAENIQCLFKKYEIKGAIHMLNNIMEEKTDICCCCCKDFKEIQFSFCVHYKSVSISVA